MSPRRHLLSVRETGQQILNYDQFLSQLRYALAVSETKDLATAATICGINRQQLVTGLERLEDAIGLKLFYIKENTVKETGSHSDFKSFLISSINKIQKYQQNQSNKKLFPKKTVRKVGVVGQNPFSLKVMPEFSELVFARSNMKFDIVFFNNPQEALAALAAKFTDFGVLIPQNSLLESRGITENADVRAIINLYPLKFSMITSGNSNIKNLSDLRGKNIAGDFPVSQAMQFMTDIYLDSVSTPMTRFNKMRFRNVTEAYRSLKSGGIRSTIYPMDAITNDEIVRGQIKFVNGEISEEQGNKLSNEYPSSKILKKRNIDGDTFNIIQMPLMLFGQKTEKKPAVDLLIEMAMQFFKRFTKHRLDVALSDAFFDPTSSGIRRHDAAREFFDQ